MSCDILFYSHDARMAKGWLDLAKAYTQFALGHVRHDEHYRVVVELDSSLYMYEQHKYHMANLSLSVPAEEEEDMQSGEVLRQGHAESQKKKEDQESLQRINEYFCNA